MIVCLDENGKAISFVDFFSKVDEFNYNQVLCDQTSRILRLLVRRDDAYLFIAEKTGENCYAVELTGNSCNYFLLVKKENDTLFLTGIN